MALPARTPILFPTELSLSESAKRWIQVAKTGKFFSSKYGNFEISAGDLQQMLHNFTTVTPIAPTQLPVDYDHLSMDPKHPGDGKAAGWFAGGMELRAGGNELWAEVEFTPDAAKAIANKEYRFVSPSFVKNYMWKNGQNIGTTMIAAAITNHPFLEGMQAVTLSAPAFAELFGEVALDLCTCDEEKKPADAPAGDKPANPFGEKKADAPADKKPAAQSPQPNQPGQPPAPSGVAMEVGQRVSVKAEVNPQFAGQALEVAEVAGAGDDQFAKLKDPTGMPLGWFRVTELEPARAPQQPPQMAAAMPGYQMPGMPGGVHMSAFKLRDTRGEEVEISAEELRKAMTPEGMVVISASKMGELEASATKVGELQQQVIELREAAEAAKVDQHVMHLTSRLDGMSQKGLITKPQRDWALKMFGEPVALGAFDEWAATCTRPVVEVGVEHGSGADPQVAPQASGQLLVAARERAKQEGISLRAAVALVSSERTDLATSYQNSFRSDDMTRFKH